MIRLVVLGGLPGTGKTTVARALAARIGAVWLRIDTIEQAIIRDAGMSLPALGTAGYAVAQDVAVDQLAAGLTVVVDCVNPVAASRRGWAVAAARGDAGLLDVHIVCSDRDEHRRRVEGRLPDIAGQAPVTWDKVLGCAFEPWDAGEPLEIDTARLAPEGAAAMIAAAIAARNPGSEAS